MSAAEKKARVCRMTEDALDAEALRDAGEILRCGGLVAFPTETVYGLGGNALDPEASRRIYAAKGRPSDNPLIVHIAEKESLGKAAAEIPEIAWKLAELCWPGPLTMILQKQDCVPKETTGGLSTVAVRFPSNRIAQALIREAGGFVAAPSANRSGRPSPTTADHVAEDLGDRIDMIIDGGPVDIGLESTIVDLSEGAPMILRPGYYSRSFLSEQIGEVLVDPAVALALPSAKAKAPGMRYRHYAPRADLTVVSGADACRRIRDYAERDTAAGLSVGILCAEENADRYPVGRVRCIGALTDEASIARHLYGALRDFDADGVDKIYSESYSTPGLGEAIMDRLLRAAGKRRE